MITAIARFNAMWYLREAQVGIFQALGMIMITKAIYIVGGCLFLASLIGHAYVRLRLRPGDDSDLDDYYYEFEDEHPGYARYEKWLRITMAGATSGVLLFFVGIAL